MASRAVPPLRARPVRDIRTARRALIAMAAQPRSGVTARPTWAEADGTGPNERPVPARNCGDRACESSVRGRTEGVVWRQWRRSRGPAREWPRWKTYLLTGRILGRRLGLGMARGTGDHVPARDRSAPDPHPGPGADVRIDWDGRRGPGTMRGSSSPEPPGPESFGCGSDQPARWDGHPLAEPASRPSCPLVST